MNVRPAEPDDLDALARLWFDVWQDSHAALMPDELRKLRTLESFRERLGHMQADTRAIGPVGAPIAFCAVKGDELYQMYVSAAAQGTGAAATLMADAEARMKANGVQTTWLSCAIGNQRAMRFYEKLGWRRTGVMVNQADTSAGPFALETWRYEKDL
jgi:ribosomal protein S18 acetylase RimI-like enzyme